MLLAGIFPISSVKGQCTLSTCVNSYDLCLSNPYVWNDHFAIDVIAEGIDEELISLMDIRVTFNNTGNIEVNETLTDASLDPNIPGAFTLSYTSSQVALSGLSGSQCDGVTVTGASPVILFTIYFSGTAGACFDFGFSSIGGLIFDHDDGTYGICGPTIETECEYEYCIPASEISGVIETIPPSQCTDSYDHRVPEVTVYILDLASVEEFDCQTLTDDHGDYACTVAAERDYSITPSKDHFPACGLTSLDLEIIRNHLLGTDCSELDENWKLIAADANLSSLISSTDMVEIQKVILELDHSMPSWRFIPTDEYTQMSAPSGCQTSVPSFNPFIELTDVDSEEKNNDFIGVKMGDVNGSCTDCSGDYRSSSLLAGLDRQQMPDGGWAFYADYSMDDLAIFDVSLKLPVSIDEVTVTSSLDTEYMLYTVKGDELRVHTFNMIEGGERISRDIPLFVVYAPELGDKGPQAFPFASGELFSESYQKVILRRGDDRPSRKKILEKKAQIGVYPNPVENVILYLGINGDQGPVLFSLFDCKGQLHFSGDYAYSGVPVKVSFGRLHKGLYYWQAQGASGLRGTGKILIQ